MKKKSDLEITNIMENVAKKTAPETPAKKEGEKFVVKYKNNNLAEIGLDLSVSNFFSKIREKVPNTLGLIFGELIRRKERGEKFQVVFTGMQYSLWNHKIQEIESAKGRVMEKFEPLKMNLKIIFPGMVAQTASNNFSKKQIRKSNYRKKIKSIDK